MSTRCTIIIKSEARNEELHIYHHHDGYPEGVGESLKRFLEKKIAKHLWSVSQWNVYDMANELIKGKCKYLDKADPDMEYELTSGQHGDENYGYIIDCDKKQLLCYKLAWDEFDWDDKNSFEIKIENSNKTENETIEAQMYFKSKERGVLKFYKAKSYKWNDSCKYCLLWRTDECKSAPCEAEERQDGQEGYFSIKNIPPTL